MLTAAANQHFVRTNHDLQVDNIEVIKGLKVPLARLKPKGNDLHMACDGQRGLTLWDFLNHLVVRGIAPVVSFKAAVLA